MTPYRKTVGSAAFGEVSRSTHRVQYSSPFALANQIRVDAIGAETGIVGGDDDVALAKHFAQVPNQSCPIRIQRWRASRRDARSWVRPSDDIAAAGRRGAGRDEDRARDRDRLALQSGGAVEKTESVAIARAAALKRPHPNDRPRLSWDLAGLNVIKRFGRVSAEAEKHGERPRRCKPGQIPSREHFGSPLHRNNRSA